MFERFTESARRVLFSSCEEARASGSASVRSEHLLLAVIRAADSIINPMLMKTGLSTDSVKEEISASQPPIPASVETPFHQESKRVLHYASEEADRLLHAFLLSRDVWMGNDVAATDDSIGPEHLLLGLLREDKAHAASILERHGITLDAARIEVAQQRQGRKLQ